MRSRFSPGFILLVTVLALVGAVAAGVQWRQTVLLRTELELARLQAEELERLRRDNERLRRQQVPAAELAVLRSDHAALPRLRAELAALEKTNY